MSKPTIKKNGDIQHDGTIELSSEFLNDWRKVINEMKKGSKRDRALAKYLICLEMYKIANGHHSIAKKDSLTNKLLDHARK